jgi:hypothetical protein
MTYLVEEVVHESSEDICKTKVYILCWWAVITSFSQQSSSSYTQENITVARLAQALHKQGKENMM